MTSMSARFALWAAATMCTAALALVSAQSPPDPDKAEKTLNSSCTGCHDLRPIQTQALDAEGWTKVVKSMIDKGAKVNQDDIPLLVDYLADVNGPMPDGAGKELILQKCTVCHDLKRVRQHLASPEDWADTLNAMLNEGLMLNDEEFATALRYLARNFRQ
jgi:cytochrome c2